jgi:ankyrin repeat protein
LDKRTKKEVKSTLDRLSKGSTALDDAYKEAIQRIEGQLPRDYARARQVLSWITYAQRPLTTAEICCALAVELDEKELDQDNIPDLEDIVSVCAGLVTVDEESNIIRLVHYTTQEYFERIREEWNPSAQLEVTLTCLTYLSFNNFRSGNCLSNRDFESRLEQNVFLNYAARHWGQHAATVQDQVYKLACSFLLHSTLVSSAAQIMLVPGHKYGNYSQRYPRNTTGLHITAQFGLNSLLEGLLHELGGDTRFIISAKDSNGQTPLYLAAEHGRKDVIHLLLDKGANVNVQGGLCGNALQAASHGGHEQVVKLLLDKGADVNAQSGTFGNALHAASQGGHEQVVKLLLDKGADVNAQGGLYGNALHAASQGGHEQVVKLLLDKGAGVIAQGRIFCNALQAASEGGHEQVVKLLLDKGADVNAQGGSYGNALHAASHGGHEQVVKLLLNKGADVIAQGGVFCNALHAASHGGHEQVVKLLLDKGADVNSQCGLYDNALQAASEGGHEQVVKLLLDKGADVDAQGGLYSNALQAASAGGHKQVVKLLLDNSANANAKDRINQTPLLWAASKGHKEVAKLLLLKEDIEPESRDTLFGHTPLSWAAKRGYGAVVELLLAKDGVNLDSKDNFGRTSLFLAAANGYNVVVELLLVRSSIDLSSKDMFGDTLLSITAKRGKQDTLKLLLDTFVQKGMVIHDDDISTKTTDAIFQKCCPSCLPSIKRCDGDFLPCSPCFARGTFCLESSD